MAVGAVATVLVAAAITLAVIQNAQNQDPIVVVTTTRPAPQPTPPEPVERDTSTPLLAALPDTVGAYAVNDQRTSEAMPEALEAWQLTYVSADDELVLDVGQWPTADDAQAAVDALLDGRQTEESADVMVDGDVVGTVVTIAADDGTERTIWSNATVVFVVSGPEGATYPFYLAYPL